ncbi:MAG: phosphopentomutase [Erysipelothrix sp.]|nr:phosphopentomutase [Erysipelothrix sp.]
MKKYKRIITVVLDSVGIGAAADADKYGDIGSDTLGNTARAVGGIKLENLEKLGLGNLHNVMGVKPSKNPLAYYTKLSEKSVGKDTMTGHWELMGLYTETPFITFTETGFPDKLIKELEEKTGHKVIGNKASSGTEILVELGQEHIDTGAMIVYTSADSVIQIAAHEKYFGLEELYRVCEIAREITMADQWKLGRVIARPFIGETPETFKRTPNRHDYALDPFGKTALDTLKAADYDVISVGKIYDIFNGKGLTESNPSQSSVHSMEQVLEIMDRDFTGLLFANLVDFDALWGHRRDPVGYAEEMIKFDKSLGLLLDKIREDDLLIITADHGNDPTAPGTDHTREMVPFIAYSPSMTGSGILPVGDTFADIGATIADNFNVEAPDNGISRLNLLD